MMDRALHLATPSMRAERPSAYESGRCNIGPAEIARRRWVGHVGAAVALGLLAVLLAMDAPSWCRLLLFVPAAVGAAGYLQAHLRFCADYGWRGVFNFGEAGHDRVTSVQDDAARTQDRRRAAMIGLASGAIGIAVVLAALLIPV